jgi:hypothetical protein
MTIGLVLGKENGTMLENNWECSWLDETVVVDIEATRRELQAVGTTLPGAENAPLPSSKTQCFVQAEFIALLEKGRIVATRMSAILTGRLVKRTYFYKDRQDGGGRTPMNIHITRIASEDGGIIRVYDSTGTIRELPSLLFEFWYRPNAVICNGADFTMLLEVVG